MKRRGRFRMVITIVVGILILIAAGMGGAVLYTSEEHKEARSLPIAALDFSKLKDGTYIGEYEGGMKKWRTNKVQVTVSSGKVTDIKILEHKENQKPEFTGELYGRVIQAQTLQVDTISSSTLTSKAYLKSVENALRKAQKQ